MWRCYRGMNVIIDLKWDIIFTIIKDIKKEIERKMTFSYIMPSITIPETILHTTEFQILGNSFFLLLHPLNSLAVRRSSSHYVDIYLYPWSIHKWSCTSEPFRSSLISWARFMTVFWILWSIFPSLNYLSSSHFSLYEAII